MNTIYVARYISERRLRPNPVVTTGELISAIGPDGVQEALRKNWLVPDMDTGFLMVNLNQGKLSEVTEACKCPKCGECACECEPCDDEKCGQAMPKGMREAWAGMGLSSPASPGSSMTGAPIEPRTPTPVSPTTQPPKAPQIGDDTMVTDDGKTYTGKVASVGQDGRYRLSFGNNKPHMDREYNPNEIRMVGAAVPNA